MEDPERRLKGTEEDIRKIQAHAEKMYVVNRAMGRVGKEMHNQATLFHPVFYSIFTAKHCIGNHLCLGAFGGVLLPQPR